MMDFTPRFPGKHDNQSVAPKSRRRISGSMIVIVVLAVLLAGSTAAATVLYVKLQDARQNQGAPTESAKAAIIRKVGKLYDIPKEDPNLARVSNSEKLRSEQEFFKNAKDGDYILVFTKAKLGILYRESSDKIINVGPVSVQSTNESNNTTQQQSGTSNQ